MSNARVSEGFKCFAMPVKTFSLGIILSLCLAFSFVPLPAGASDALIKEDIEIDVTGKDAVDARAKAMEQAEADGLRAMLERFTSPQAAQSLVETMSPKKISSLVRGIEVLSERISDRRYRAHLLVAFDGKEISNLITASTPEGGVLDSSSASAYLIIPAYEEASKSMLWE